MEGPNSRLRRAGPGFNSFYSFSDFRKDQNAQIHQKLFGGPQMSPRVAWYQFETPLRALSTILPESDHFSQKPVRMM